MGKRRAERLAVPGARRPQTGIGTGAVDRVGNGIAQGAESPWIHNGIMDRTPGSGIDQEIIRSGISSQPHVEIAALVGLELPAADGESTGAGRRRNSALEKERLDKDKKTPGKTGQRSCFWMNPV